MLLSWTSLLHKVSCSDGFGEVGTSVALAGLLNCGIVDWEIFSLVLD